MLNNASRQETVSSVYNNIEFRQRLSDGYCDATAMCKANGKLFADYFRLDSTKEFIQQLTTSMGFPIDVLVVVNTKGKNEVRGTFVHPLIANHLAMWCSAKFAVHVSLLIEAWKQGRLEYKPKTPSPDRQSSIETRKSFADAFFAVGKGQGELIASTKKITMAIFDMPPERVKFHLGLKDGESLRNAVTGYAQNLFQTAENVVVLDLMQQQEQGSKRISSSEATRKAVEEVERTKATFEKALGHSLLVEEITLRKKAKTKPQLENRQLSLLTDDD